MKHKLTVLYITLASTNFDGATYSLFDLIKSVDDYINPIVLVRSKGCVYEFFVANGIKCIVHNFEDTIISNPKRFRTYIKNALIYIPKLWRYYIKNNRCIKEVCTQLKGTHIDIVHTNNTAVTVGYKIAQALTAKHIWHLRGYLDLDFGWKPFFGWKQLKSIISKSDAVIGITNSVLMHFMDTKNEKTFAIFDAVRSKHEICCYPKERYFLFCSVFLTKKKGFEIALRAFADSKTYEFGYRLRVIGIPINNDFSEINTFLHNLGISEYVDFIGHTTDVKAHMSHATALLMCSDNEGLGRVSIEAMFYGCPVIARNSGGSKEFIIHNKTGFLFETVKDCSLLLRHLTNSQSHHIIETAQDYVSENFSIENYGLKISNIYKSLTN